MSDQFRELATRGSDQRINGANLYEVYSKATALTIVDNHDIKESTLPVIVGLFNDKLRPISIDKAKNDPLARIQFSAIPRTTYLIRKLLISIIAANKVISEEGVIEIFYPNIRGDKVSLVALTMTNVQAAAIIRIALETKSITLSTLEEIVEEFSQAAVRDGNQAAIVDIMKVIPTDLYGVFFL